MNSKETKKKVIVEANGQEFIINVSQGNQTFKWLALTLQSRLRETQKSIRGANEPDKGFLVTGLLNKDGDLIDPRDMICEHAIWIDNQWRLRAQTSSIFPSDAWGNPVYNDWAAAAYLTNELNFRWTLEMDSWRMRLNAGEELAGQGPSGSSSLIQIGEAPDIDTAFELDWSIMHWKWLPSLSDILKASLRSALKERYELVLAIFRHYCGAGELGQRYGMTTVEFEHLLQMVMLDNRTAEAKEIGQIDREAALGKDAKAGTGKDSARPEDKDSSASVPVTSTADTRLTTEQLQVLAQLTYEKTAPTAVLSFIESAAQPDVSIKYNSTKSDAKWVLMSRSHMTQALICFAVESEAGATILESVIKFIDGPLLQFWQRIVNNYTLYRYLEDQTFAEAFQSTYQLIKQLFISYGSIHPRRGPTMSIEKCIWLFKNSLFVGSALDDVEQEGACTVAVLQSTFTTHSLVGHVAATKIKLETEFQDIVFIEFLETLASVALVAEADSGMEVGKKMRLAFNTIIQMQPQIVQATPSSNHSKK